LQDTTAVVEIRSSAQQRERAQLTADEGSDASTV
jgi:hypothetical protein